MISKAIVELNACVKAFRELAHDKCPAVVSHADVIGLDVAQIALSDSC